MNAALRTERLELEPLEPRHAGELFEALRDPELYRYIPQDGPPSEDAVRARCVRVASRRSPDGREGWLNWLVRDRATGRCVGRVEATVLGDAAEIAYMFAPDAGSKGLATEACRAMIAHLRGSCGVAVLLATVDERNLRSRALVERLGFDALQRRSATLRGAASMDVIYRLALPPG